MAPYVPVYNAGDLTNMGVDTAGGVMNATASQSGNVASLGILGGAIMPQLGNVTKQSAGMLTSIGGPSATAAAEKASDDAKKPHKAHSASVGGTGTMVHSVGHATATANAEKASADAKKLCASCQGK